MPLHHYITASCAIGHATVVKNEARVFENNALSLQDFLPAVYHHFQFNYPKFFKMDNLCKAGWLASEILLTGSFKKDEYLPEQVGMVFANANGSLDVDLRYLESTKTFASPSLFVYTLPNIVMGEISIRNQFKGESAFFIQERFDADFIEHFVNNLVNSDILQACICGWVDVLGEHCEALLALVEKKQTNESAEFTAENLRSLYQKFLGDGHTDD